MKKTSCLPAATDEHSQQKASGRLDKAHNYKSHFAVFERTERVGHDKEPGIELRNEVTTGQDYDHSGLCSPQVVSLCPQSYLSIELYT